MRRHPRRYDAPLSPLGLMKQLPVLFVLAAMLHAAAVAAQPNAGDESVGLLPQTAPGTPWSFIGFAIATPSDPAWMVSVGTPRSGTMGRAASAGADGGASLVISSELVESRSTATPRCWPLRATGMPDFPNAGHSTSTRKLGPPCRRSLRTASDDRS
jgi:hypothetical protein